MPFAIGRFSVLFRWSHLSSIEAQMSSETEKTQERLEASSKAGSSLFETSGVLCVRKHLQLLSVRLNEVGDVVEAEKLKFEAQRERHARVADQTQLYHAKLVGLRDEMVSLRSRSSSLRDRALKLMERRQQEALQQELRRQAERDRDQELMAQQEKTGEQQQQQH